jgi:hypothetical protein
MFWPVSGLLTTTNRLTGMVKRSGDHAECCRYMIGADGKAAIPLLRARRMSPFGTNQLNSRHLFEECRIEEQPFLTDIGTYRPSRFLTAAVC